MTFEDQRNAWIVYMADFKNLRKIWDCQLIATLHVIKLYVLGIYQQRPWSECVLRISLWLNDWYFQIYDESWIWIFHFVHVWYDWVKFYVKNGCVDPYRQL